MDVYMSFWSIGNNAIKPAVVMTQKSVELIKRYYNGVHLITDEQGAETFKDIDWLSVSTELESLPKEYKDVWSLGKLKAFNIIANKHKPFMHIDYDFFLLRKVPDYIEQADVFFQSKEDLAHFKSYCLDSIYNECEELPFECNSRLSTAFNCGIIGGNNYDFFKKYTELSLETVLNSCNRDFWLGDIKDLRSKYDCFRPATKALLAEQYFGAYVCMLMNITPTLLIDGPYYVDKHQNDLFIHLYGRFKARNTYEAKIKLL